MADQWNPGNPSVAGLEWPASNVEQPALSKSQLVGVRAPSSAAETIGGIAVFVDALVEGANGVGVLPICVDIYDDANPISALDGHGAMVNPVVNGSNDAVSGSYVRCSGTIASYSQAAFDVNAYTDVDQIYGDSAAMPAAGDTLTFLRYTPGGPTDLAWITERMNTSAVLSADGSSSATLTGMRVTRLSVVGVVANPSATSATVRGVIRQGGQNYYSAPVTVPANSSWTRYKFDFDFSPVTGHQWSRGGDLADLMTGGSGSAGLAFTATGPLLVTSVVLRAWLTTETRVATGFQWAALGAPSGWTTVLLAATFDHSLANWSKASGHTYDIVVSLGGFGGQGKLSAPYSTIPGLGLASNGWRGITAAANGRAEPIVAAPTPFPWVPAMFMVKSDTTIGVDAQPYVRPLALAVDSTHDVEQVITNPGALTYAVFAALVQMTSDGHGGALQNGALNVELRKTSDDSLLAGPVAIDSLSATGLVDGLWHRVIAQWSPGAVLTLNESVYLKFSSTSTVPWQIGALLTYGVGESVSNASAESRTYGGTTARGRLNGAAHTEIDLPAVIAPAPSAPGTLASSEVFTANAILSTGPTQQGHISAAHLTWAVTSLGGGVFDHYEVQRQDYDPLLSPAAWVPVMVITDESKHAWDDLEARRTVLGDLATKYRIRVVRTDGITSPWAAFPDVSLHAGDCAVYLVSNFAPTLACAFYDHSPQPFKWPEMDDVKLVKMLGRDFRVQFRPTERLGDAFTRTITVVGNDPTVADTAAAKYRRGRPPFEPVLAAVRAIGAPYLTWADAHGNRWFASIKVGEARWSEPGGFYFMDIDIEQISATGNAVLTDTPWVAP